MPRAARKPIPSRSAPASGAVRVHAPAKVNLGLWILGRRPDGYHEIDTVLQTIDLEDELVLRAADAPGIRLTLEGRRIPAPAGGEPEPPNLVVRAWHRLLAEKPELADRGIEASLLKRIPVGAGLGGGSSDAAALLAGVNALFQLGIGVDRLEALAGDLGSDCPFFVQGGAARATGRGDLLRHLRPMPPTWGVLVSPPVAVSTSWAYGLLRNRLTPGGGAASILESAVAHGDVGAAVDARFNAFEDVILPHVPVLAALQRDFAVSGAWGPLMSGSGSSFYTLARSEREARAVAEAIAQRYADVRVMRTRERGVTVARME